jgi:hypothetical protein
MFTSRFLFLSHLGQEVNTDQDPGHNGLSLKMG